MSRYSTAAKKERNKLKEIPSVMKKTILALGNGKALNRDHLSFPFLQHFSRPKKPEDTSVLE